jgi:putative endopeptidase
MKNIKYLIIITLIFFITGCTQTKELTIKDDYYTYTNKELLKENKLKKGEYIWSTFTSAQDEVNKEVDETIKKLISTNINPNLNIIYNQLLDDTTRNTNNLSSLEPYLEKIDSSSNIKEFITNSIFIEDTLNIDIFTNIKIDSDFKDNTQNIAYFYPITFDFGTNSDYYINEDYISYKALIKQYGLKLLKQYGYDKAKAREISTNITNMYINIASNSKLSSDLEDISNYYNIITKDDLQKIYTNIDINYYLKEKGLSNETKFSIVDINNYKSLNKYLTNDNLSLLKEYVKLKILENYAIYLSDNYANLIYELNNKISSTTKDNDTKEDKANNIIKNIFTYDIDKYYQENYFSKKEKEYIEKMIKDILSYYEKDINSLNWLSNQTKDKAKLKLKNMTINIGLEENYPTYSNKYNLSSSNSLVDNIIKIGNTISQYELTKLETNKKEQQLSQTTVNAYYNPSDNSINFPVASSKLFNIKKTYYQNLGSIGMVIAHEITHAFDSNGSKFDEFGNLSNWWTKKDYNNFQKLQQKVIKYYNKYEVLDGLYIDGKATVNENIADLGSISCITNLALNRNATTRDLKQMYKSLSNMWATTTTEEYQKLLLLQDNHAPAKYRVNATLSSTNTFYKVYNITKSNDMYIPEKQRITVW